MIWFLAGAVCGAAGSTAMWLLLLPKTIAQLFHRLRDENLLPPTYKRERA